MEYLERYFDWHVWALASVIAAGLMGGLLLVGTRPWVMPRRAYFRLLVLILVCLGLSVSALGASLVHLDISGFQFVGAALLVFGLQFVQAALAWDWRPWLRWGNGD